MIIKSGVIFDAKAPLLYALWRIEIIMEPFGQVVATSIRDGKHGVNSLHYQGLAVDIRSKHLDVSQKRVVLSSLKRALGIDYDVILEAEGLENEHYHIEYDPKTKVA